MGEYVLEVDVVLEKICFLES